MKYFYSFLVSFFLIVASVFPSGFVPVKLFLLLIITIKTLLDFQKIKFKLPKNALIFLAIFISYFCISLTFSVINSYGFNLRILSEYIILPILYPLAAFQIAYLLNLNTRISLLYLITIFCIFFNVINFLDQLKIISIPLLTFMQGPAKITDDVLMSRLPNQVTLIFLTPFLILFKPKLKLHLILKPFIAITAIIVAFFSGRRALQFTVIFGLILYTINYLSVLRDISIIKIQLSRLNKLNTFVNFILFSSFIYFLVIINNQFDILDLIRGFGNTLSSAFNSLERSSSIRELQGQRLIEEGFKNPLFGRGATANLVDLIRSEDTKWSYELRYHAMFFQTGLVGLSLYLIVFLRVSIMNFNFQFSRFSYSNYHLTLAISFFLFIISAYSNPFYTLPLPWLICLTTFYDKEFLKK